MGQCKLCNTISNCISKELGVCLKCIRATPDKALPIAIEAHKKSRVAFGLPEVPPKDTKGFPCNICVNECRIPENGTGYCGLRKNIGGRLKGVSPKEGKLSWYHDPLPTNCVADWVCPGGTGAGYPECAYTKGPEYGYKNLAVFFHACSFNCLFCQNWHFKELTLKPDTVSLDEFVSAVDEKTSCICYFGGDPAPQIPFAINASRLAVEKNKGRILRICWETNGSMHPSFLKEMARLSFDSCGCIKFDLKAWNEEVNLSLCGTTNKRTIENFRLAAQGIEKRPKPPLLIASTLLVPGYVDEEEVAGIAKFIASLNKDIPYALLAFSPHFYMEDLPATSRSHAYRCKEAAERQGLKNVRLGNVHLLQKDTY